MPTISGQHVVEQLQWRYATKIFDADRKINDDDWQSLEDTLVLSPSSYGLQPWKFLVVTDTAIRESLVEHSWNQRQVADASHLLVFAVNKNMTEGDVDRHVDRVVEVHRSRMQNLGSA